MKQETGGRRCEKGDVRPEAGDVRQETGDRRSETGDVRQEKREARCETWDTLIRLRQEMWDMRHETTWYKRQETVRQEMRDKRQSFFFSTSDSLIPSFLKSDVSKSAKLLMTKEQLWANRSGCSPKMCDCERFAQVAHLKWATVSKSLRLLTKNEQIARFFWANCSFPHFFAK